MEGLPEDGIEIPGLTCDVGYGVFVAKPECDEG
jgi:hypothetical protein